MGSCSFQTVEKELKFLFIMNDQEMFEEEDKENVRPTSQVDSMFRLETFSTRFFNILPVNFNRKRRRSSDMEECQQSKEVKRNKVSDGRRQNTFLKSIMALPRLLTRLDRSDTEQHYDYLDYLNQRESLD